MNNQLFSVSLDKKRARTQDKIPLCETQAKREADKAKRDIKNSGDAFDNWVEGLSW